MAGIAGYQAESYWCRRILQAVRSKLAKLGKGHYEPAASHHLLLYDDMDTKVAIVYGEALKRIVPRLRKVLQTTPLAFATVSIVTTQNRVLFDVSGESHSMLPVPRT